MFNNKKKNEKHLLCAYSQKPCMGEGCHKWIHVQGKDPQSGADVDMFDCADRWMPTLTIDLTRKMHSLVAAVETSRNESSLSAAHLIGSLQAVAEATNALKLPQAPGGRVVNP